MASGKRQVIINRRYYTIDDTHDGDACADHEPPEIVACADTDEAIETLISEGLSGPCALSVYPVPDTFTGHEWLSRPDDSAIADTWDAHYTGARVEVSGHLIGWSPAEFAHIIRTVTGNTGR